jgi:hypothetical protein
MRSSASFIAGLEAILLELPVMPLRILTTLTASVGFSRERPENSNCMIKHGANNSMYALACLPIGGFDGSVARPDRG